MQNVIVALAGLVGIGIALTFLARRSRRPILAVRAVVSGLLGLNGLGVLVSALLLVVMFGAPLPALAQEGAQPAGDASGVTLGCSTTFGSLERMPSTLPKASIAARVKASSTASSLDARP